MLWVLAIFGCLFVLLAFLEGIPALLKKRFEEQGEFEFSDCLMGLAVLALVVIVMSAGIIYFIES